ncbi:nitrilase-related carbon-nitrogen hydrolase [Halobacillus faecis]
MKKSYIFSLLLLGTVLMMLSNGKYLIAIAAWVFPVALMVAVKDLRGRWAWILLTLIMALGNQLSFHHMLPELEIPLFGYIPALAGALYAVPFVLQKLCYRVTPSFLVTLIFPSSYALLDYVNVYLNPFGTFGVLGYSQAQFLPMAQVASLIGVTGITFVITWVAAIVYWLILDRPKVHKKRVALATIMILLLTIVWGSLRINDSAGHETVLVSGIHTLDRNNTEVLEIFNLRNKDLNDFTEKTEKQLEILMKRTTEEAEAGAKIIHHSEGTAVMDESQRTSYLRRLQGIAEQYDVYIITVPYVFTEADKKNENVLYVLDPNGEIVLEHYKYGGNFIEQTVTKGEEIHAVDTPYGRLTGIICWDKDFPSVVNQVGEKDIDHLFIPSADWEEISPYHTIVGNFRGIENGANTVTQTVNGMSMMTDYTGQTLAKMNHFTTDHWVMRGHMPVRGTNTFYTSIGKYFGGWVVGVFIGLLLFFFKKRRHR